MKLNWNDGALAEGLRCFARREYFTAHEHWESMWLKCEEPQRSFLQALIQLAAAFHHHQRNNPRGAASLLKRALQKLERFPECFEHIDVAELRSSIADWLRALEARSKVLPSHPQIHFVQCLDEEQKAD